jgi:preprotein translocase subunit SecE
MFLHSPLVPAAKRRRRRRTLSVAWYLGIFIVFLAAFDMLAYLR